MRDPSHMEQVERWARFVRDNPDKWKKMQGEFIDAQIFGAWRFYERLAKTEGGEEKIRKLKEMRMSRRRKALLSENGFALRTASL